MGRKEYARSPDMRFVRKFPKVRWRECSTCQMFFNSSLIVSIIDLFRSIIFSLIDISEFFMFLQMPVTRCIPLTKSCSKSFCPMYPCLQRVYPAPFSRSSHPSAAPYRPRYQGLLQNKNLIFVIDHQIKFEAEEVPHGGFPSLRHAFKYHVVEYALIMASSQRRGINKGYSCATAQLHNLNKQHHRK